MSQNKFTTNSHPTLVAVSNADGETPVYLYANPSTHGLIVDATVTATVDTTGLATDTNQVNGSQKAQIVDAGGEAVTVTGGKLDVNASVDTTGLATSAKQDSLLTELQLKADLTETQPVSLASVPSHPVTNAGTFAVQATEADGANATLGAKADAKSTATDTTAISAMSVLKQISASVQAPPSQAVTNAGTFAVQATGTKTNNSAAPTTDNVGVLPALVNSSSPSFTEGNQTLLSINTTGNLRTTLNQLAGTAVSTGNGASGSGVLRVAQVSDGTGVIATVGAVTAITNALPAGTNAIGKLAANSGVDIGDVDVTTVGTITPGTAATSLGKAEDAVHTTGDTGVFSLGVRNDTLADVTNASADYSQLSTDIKGRVMTAGAPRALKGTAQVSLSNTTSETTVIAATASTFHDVYGLILANTGATTTKVSIRDDTAGTVKAVIEVPTLETRGFMLPVDSAISQTATNKNWTAQCASATTALEITALYVSMV